jgi:hypothetical protein
LTDNADVYLNGNDKRKPPERKEQDGNDKRKPPERKEQDGNDKRKTERDGREENKEC